MRLAPYQPRRARIEIIPMIDTIFFLLVFFMIASLAMTTMKGLPVTLPKSGTAASRPVDKIVLTLTNDGKYFVDKQHVAFDEIQPLLAARIAKSPETAVIINCDERQNVSRLVEMADEAKRSGAQLLTIATSPKDDASKK